MNKQKPTKERFESRFLRFLDVPCDIKVLPEERNFPEQPTQSFIERKPEKGLLERLSLLPKKPLQTISSLSKNEVANVP